MKRPKIPFVSLSLFVAVVILSTGWWMEHGQLTTARATLDELRTETSPLVRTNDPQPERQHIPLVGIPKGTATAPITIVEFVDFQCPYCGRATETIDQVFKEYLGQVRFYVCHSPLPFHPDATPAAEAALAAEEQGKFWQMHDKLMASQRNLARDELEAYAREIGLDMGKFVQSLDAQSHQSRIDQDISLAEKVGARGTPTFFINGRKLSGAQPLEAFQAVIDEELSRAQELVAKGTPAAKIYDVLTANATPAGGQQLRR